MKRTHLALAGLLLLQVVLILIFRSPFSGASAGVETRPLFPELVAGDTVRMEIRGADETRIELVKDGGLWSIEELGGFPADKDKVDALLAQFGELKVRRPVVSSGRYHETFKVAEDDNEGRVLLWNEGNDDPGTDLLLGTSPNYRSIHVRRAEDDRVFEVQGLARFDVGSTSSAWIVKDLVDVDAESVVGFGLTNESGSFRLEKREGTWVVASPVGSADLTLDPAGVEELVRTGPVDETAQGFDNPAATVNLTWSSGEEGAESVQELVVRIGGQVEDQDTLRYATRSGFGYTGTVWASSVSRLVEDGLDDLQGS